MDGGWSAGRALRKPVMGLVVAGPLVAVGYAIFALWNRMVGWQDIALLTTIYLLVGLGVTIGYHRLLTHGSLNARRPVKIALLILGTMSIQGRPISWAANHRLHHARSDREGDPHSPNLNRNAIVGFAHAHLGWLFQRGQAADEGRWARDLLNDPDVVFINRLAPVWFLAALVIPFAIGGWSGLLWGGLVRISLTHHATWSVNSVCHVFGSRAFSPKDQSRNHWLVGLLALGEGGHNTHHASPRSARHGLRWWHFDLSWVVICALQEVRLIRDVYTLDAQDLKRALQTKASGVKVALRHRLPQETRQTIAAVAD